MAIKSNGWIRWHTTGRSSTLPILSSSSSRVRKAKVCGSRLPTLPIYYFRPSVCYLSLQSVVAVVMNPVELTEVVAKNGIPWPWLITTPIRSAGRMELVKENLTALAFRVQEYLVVVIRLIKLRFDACPTTIATNNLYWQNNRLECVEMKQKSISGVSGVSVSCP